MIQQTIFNNLFDSPPKAPNPNRPVSKKLLQAPSILSQKISSLVYPYCNITDHEDEPLSMICIDSECKKQGLICSLCQADEHISHNIVSLKLYISKVFGDLNVSNESSREQKGQFLIKEINLKKIDEDLELFKNKNKNKSKGKNKQKKITEFLNSSPKQLSVPLINCQQSFGPPKILHFTLKIDQLKQTYLSTLGIFKQNFINQIMQLQTIGIKYFNKVKQQTAMAISIQNPLEFISKTIQKISNQKQGQDKSIRKLKKYVKNMLKVTNFQQKFYFEDHLKKIKDSCEEITKNMQKNMAKVSTTIQKAISQEIKYLQPLIKIDSFKSNQPKTLPSKNFPFLFCEPYKGAKMIIKQSGKVLQQTGMQSSGQRFALLNPCLLKSQKIFKTQKEQTWAIKIVKLVGWIGVGIGLRKQIMAKGFKFQYSQIGHGSYLISSNGYSWSHSQKQSNSQYKSFLFQTGDTVIMVYNSLLKKLTFFKNIKDGLQKFELNVTQPVDDELHPCVNICSIGDNVEVINFD